MTQKIDVVDERRSSERLPLVLEVCFPTLKDFLIELAQNISNNGIFVVSQIPLPLGTHADLRIKLPKNGPTLEVRGKVVHSLSPERALYLGRLSGMGIQFTEYFGSSKTDLHVYFDELRKASKF